MAFDPTAHAVLIELGARLRDLAGDASYKAGRDYLKKGAVRNGTVAGTTAYATVSGSTDYRVTVAFGAEVKVSCTCPAHRRNRFCKHVVALGVALLERPGEFTVDEAAPEPPPKPPRTKARAKDASSEAPAVAESRGAGLETVEQLLSALAVDGLPGLGPDKRALLTSAGELVRARKLRRLGNQILALQRVAEPARGSSSLDPEAFAALMIDLSRTYRATRAHLEGRVSLSDELAENLLGKTWREPELPVVRDLELVEVATVSEDDGEFRIDSGYLVDVPTGTIYVERQISPRRFNQSRVPHRCRLLVDEARLYPEPSPQRIRLTRARRAVLGRDDVGRLVERADTRVADLRRRLVDHLDLPLAPRFRPVLFRPAALVAQGDLHGALDRQGSFLALESLPPFTFQTELLSVLPEAGDYALFGLLDLPRDGLTLHCLSVVGALRWERGPVYPDSIARK